MEFEVGQYVMSKRGRDKGRVFVIVKEIDDRYVEVADGELRKITNPKKKNKKHLVNLGKEATEIRSRLTQGNKVTNEELRAAVNAFLREKGLARE